MKIVTPCPICKKDGIKTESYHVSGSTTLLDFSGPAKYNPNTITNTYRCDRGHKFTIINKRDEETILDSDGNIIKEDKI